jgi:predicted enzyme related to lactoylglutathione lyase
VSPAASEPFDVLRRPTSPHQPDPQFRANLRQHLEEELGMTASRTYPPVPQAIDVGIVHVKVRDADESFAFYRALLGWQSEPFRNRDEGFTAHYIVNTSLLTVLTDNPDAPPVRLWFPVDDVDAGRREVERLGGTVTRSEVTVDGGGWAEVDDGQGVAVGLWRPGRDHPRSGGAVDVPRGELGYFTFKVPDAERGATFFHELLGWRLDDPRPNGYRHALGSQPSVGMYPGSDDEAGAVALYVRTPDVVDLVERARALGAEVSELATSPSGVTARCTDPDGLALFLWQPAPDY